jgi:RNA polymerase sigma factor (sigma-70 family)
VLLLLQSAIASAQPPLGDEFEINSYTTGNQQRTAIAAGPAGDFVVAWSSQGSTGSDTSNYSIQARRFDAAGAPLGSQFQVNTYTTEKQTYPSVARDAVGNFVVVWESDENSGSIKGQRYDSAGMPLGGEFPVSTAVAAFRPAVSMNGDGSFVAAWVGSTFGAGSEFARVLGQRFGTDGAPVGAEFQVNTLTTNNQWFPAVAVLRRRELLDEVPEHLDVVLVDFRQQGDLARLLFRRETRRSNRERAAATREILPSASEESVRFEALRRVVLALDRLAPDERALLVRRFYDEWPPRRIAADLGIPVNTVRTRIARALANLRRELVGARPQDEPENLRALLIPLLSPPAWSIFRRSTACSSPTARFIRLRSCPSTWR